MAGPVPASRAPHLGRWILIAALILIGLGLYFWYAPTSRPAAPPPEAEGL